MKASRFNIVKKFGFTLIELLIVVAIIAILAAIAVPNFLEAQIRSKVSRVNADMRSLAIAIESYRVDHNKYAEGTDDPNKIPENIYQFLYDRGYEDCYYTFRTRGLGGLLVGRDFDGITTPIAYMSSIPTDPFATQSGGFLTYCYRPAKIRGNGYIITSFGPDVDMFANLLGKKGVGDTDTTNPLSTASDKRATASASGRMGDVNEEEYCFIIEDNFTNGVATAADKPRLKEYIGRLSYDPTNGTVSNGDIIRVGP